MSERGVRNMVFSLLADPHNVKGPDGKMGPSTSQIPTSS